MKTSLHPPLMAILAPMITNMISGNGKSTLGAIRCVRITAGPGYIRLRATDLDRDIDIRCGQEPDEPDFDRLVEWKPLAAAVKRDRIEIEVTPDGTFMTSEAKGVAHKTLLDSFDRDFLENCQLDIRSEDFGWHPVGPEFLENLAVLEGVTSDDETRYVLHGVFCDFENQHMIATDGRIMNIIKTDLPKLEFAKNPNNQWYRPESGVTIPRHKTFNKAELIVGRAGEIRIGANHLYCTKEESEAALASGSKEGPHYVEPYDRNINLLEYRTQVGPVSILLRTRLIEGNYPNYLQVIPEQGKITVEFDAKAALAQLKSLGAHKLDHILLETEPNKLTFSRREQATVVAKFTIPAKVKATLKIATVYQCLEYALKNGFSRVHLTDGESPLLFEAPNSRLVVMPCRVMGAAEPKKEEEKAA